MDVEAADQSSGASNGSSSRPTGTSIVGNVTLPPGGYQSRLSDSLNRPDISFIPMVDVEICPLDGGEPCGATSS